MNNVKHKGYTIATTQGRFGSAGRASFAWVVTYNGEVVTLDIGHATEADAIAEAKDTINHCVDGGHWHHAITGKVEQ